LKVDAPAYSKTGMDSIIEIMRDFEFVWKSGEYSEIKCFRIIKRFELKLLIRPG